MTPFHAETDGTSGVLLALTAYATGLMFAWLEIEIEGAYPWSRDNPHTWRLSLGGICINGLPLTGYHLTMFATVLMVAFGSHIFERVIGGYRPAWETFFAVMAYYFYVVLIEDYEWYVYNQEYKLAGARAPFGSCTNRYGRYVLNLCILVPCWLLSFGLRPANAPIFAGLADSHELGVRLVHGMYILLVAFGVTTLLLLLERVTMLPLYKTVREAIKKHDTVTGQMEYDPKAIQSPTPQYREKICYYVVPDKDNMRSFRGSTTDEPFIKKTVPTKFPSFTIRNP